MTRPWLTTLVVLSMILAVPAIVQAAPDQKSSWLLAIQGRVAAVTAGKMSLATQPSAIAFTDRPQRQVRLVDLAAFVTAAWGEKGQFRQDPPNASMVNESNDSIGVVEVTDAAWTNGTLTVSFERLRGHPPNVGDAVALTFDSVNSVPDGGL